MEATIIIVCATKSYSKVTWSILRKHKGKLKLNREYHQILACTYLTPYLLQEAAMRKSFEDNIIQKRDLDF